MWPDRFPSLCSPYGPIVSQPTSGTFLSVFASERVVISAFVTYMVARLFGTALLTMATIDMTNPYTARGKLSFND
jgi:hypothetical protein